MSDRAIDLFRREYLGLAMQSSLLVDHLNVESNVGLPLLIGGRPIAEIRPAVAELLEALKIGHLAKANPKEISRGEARRISIARMLIHKPRLALADEPTLDLDRNGAADVVRLLRGSNPSAHRSALVVSNDPDVTVYADRIVEVRGGKLWSDTGTIVGIRSGSHVA